MLSERARKNGAYTNPSPEGFSETAESVKYVKLLVRITPAAIWEMIESRLSEGNPAWLVAIRLTNVYNVAHVLERLDQLYVR